MESKKPPEVSQFDEDGNLIAYGAKFYSDWGDFDIYSPTGVPQLGEDDEPVADRVMPSRETGPTREIDTDFEP